MCVFCIARSCRLAWCASCHRKLILRNVGVLDISLHPSGKVVGLLHVCWFPQLVPGELPAFLEPVRRQLLLAGLQMRVLRRLPPAVAAAALADGWAASAAAEATRAAAIASEQAAMLGGL